MTTTAGAIKAVAATPQPPPPQPQPAPVGIKLTAVSQGYYRLKVNGTVVSSHLQEREAIDRGVDAKLRDPQKDVRYVHDYEVKIELE